MAGNQVQRSITKTLVVGPYSSKCGNCGLGANPSEKTHETVLSYSETDAEGCGVEWEFVSNGYICYPGLDESIKELRPDLEFVEWASLTLTGLPLSW